MPRTGKSSIFGNDAILQRCSIMRAPRIEGMDFIVQLDEENLPFLNAFDFSLDLV